MSVLGIQSSSQKFELEETKSKANRIILFPKYGLRRRDRFDHEKAKNIVLHPEPSGSFYQKASFFWPKPWTRDHLSVWLEPVPTQIEIDITPRSELSEKLDSGQVSKGCILVKRWTIASQRLKFKVCLSRKALREDSLGGNLKCEQFDGALARMRRLTLEDFQVYQLTLLEIKANVTKSSQKRPV